MRRLSTSGLFLLAACGAQVNGGPTDLGGADAGGSGDAALPVDAGDPPLGMWSAPAKVTGAATAATEDDVTLSPDGLELVFAVEVGNGNRKDLYYTSRPARDAAWGVVVKLALSTDAFSEEAPRFSGDGHTLYFASDSAGDLDIYAVDRSASATTEWGPMRAIDEVNTGAVEKWFAPCAGGRYVVVRGVGGETDLFEGVLGSQPPTPITTLNTVDSDTGAFLTQDCLTIYFASFHVTPERIFFSRRTSVAAPWSAPRQVEDFKLTSGTDNQEDPSMSADGRTFVFASDANGGNKDIYFSTR